MFRRCFRFFAPSSSSALDIQAAYRILGISSSKATPEDARQKYLKLARQYHPDVSNGDDTKMKQINLAYEVVQSYAAQHGKDATLKNVHEDSSSTKKRNNQQQQDGENGEQQEDHSDGDDEFGGETAYQRRKRERRQKSASPLGDASNWNTRPEFEWNAAIFSVSESEMANRANHPNSYNRHFSFNDDANIFKSVRSGATVEEVARSMGRSAFSIEARMNSTQFKLRIQKMLKADRFQRNNNLDGDHPSSGGNTYDQNDGDDYDGKNHHNKSGMMSKSNKKIKSQFNFQSQVHPYRDTVYRNPDYVAAKKKREEFYEGDLPFLHPEEIPADLNDDDTGGGDHQHEDFFGQFSAKKIQSAHGRSYAHMVNHMRSTNKSAGMKNTRRFQ